MSRIDQIIEPTNNKQRKKLEGYVKYLKITLPQEMFVLKSILSFDWHRKIIIESIDHIKYSKSLGLVKFRVVCTVPRSTTDYTVSNPFKIDGWDESMSLEDKKDYVYNSLYRYIT